MQECYRKFVVSSLPACGRLYVVLHCIVDSMTCFVSVDCSGLRKCFEGWGCFDIYQIEQFPPVCIEPEDEYSNHTRDPIV